MPIVEPADGGQRVLRDGEGRRPRARLPVGRQQRYVHDRFTQSGPFLGRGIAPGFDDEPGSPLQIRLPRREVARLERSPRLAQVAFLLGAGEVLQGNVERRVGRRDRQVETRETFAGGSHVETGGMQEPEREEFEHEALSLSGVLFDLPNRLPDRRREDWREMPQRVAEGEKLARCLRVPPRPERLQGMPVTPDEPGLAERADDGLEIRLYFLAGALGDWVLSPLHPVFARILNCRHARTPLLAMLARAFITTLGFASSRFFRLAVPEDAGVKDARYAGASGRAPGTAGRVAGARVRADDRALPIELRQRPGRGLARLFKRKAANVDEG